MRSGETSWNEREKRTNGVLKRAQYVYLEIFLVNPPPPNVLYNTVDHNGNIGASALV